VFSAEGETLQFDEAALTPEVITGVQAQVRERILRLFKRRELLSPEVVEAMREWDHAGGFSLNADVTVPASDRSGLERLFRYCARPIFASERLQWIEKNQRLIYRLPKPRPNGQTVLNLTPQEFLDKLALLVPPPRKHRHRYHGVLAPNALLRQAVTAYAGLPWGDNAMLPDQEPVNSEDLTQGESRAASSTGYLWAMLMARIYEILPLVCPQCGGEMEIIAFITEVDPIHRVLNHIGEPTKPPQIASARAPPVEWGTDFDQTSLQESGHAERIPEFEYDQTVNW
jgi:hypothetical protein